VRGALTAPSASALSFATTPIRRSSRHRRGGGRTARRATWPPRCPADDPAHRAARHVDRTQHRHGNRPTVRPPARWRGRTRPSAEHLRPVVAIPVTNVPDPRVLLPLNLVQRPLRVSPAAKKLPPGPESALPNLPNGLGLCGGTPTERCDGSSRKQRRSGPPRAPDGPACLTPCASSPRAGGRRRSQSIAVLQPHHDIGDR